MSKIQRYTEVAYNEACKSVMNKKIGAVLVQRGKIIARGYNRNTIHTTTPKQLPKFGQRRKIFSTHAEVDCVSKCKEMKREPAVLYIIRVDNNGIIVPIKPCKECLDFINKNELKYVCLGPN
jgi:deoxycytidylate deaminase